jgi:ATP-dependent HslUV protease subunit HslV
VTGFAGSTSDAITLLELFEARLDQYNGQLLRASVELAKSWRSEKALRHLDATLLVANGEMTLELTGRGDVLEAQDGVMAIGSGGSIALGAARALIDSEHTAEVIAVKALKIAAEIDIYTNGRYTLLSVPVGKPPQLER